MSTKAQVYIEDTGIYLYQHFDGNNLPDLIKNILPNISAFGINIKNNPDYLARVIFSNMIKNDINGMLNYGICTTKHGDIDYLITINCEKRNVLVYKIDRKKKKNIDKYNF